MKYFFALLLPLLLLAACGKQQACTEDPRRSPATILRISGPDTLRPGETVPLLIEAATGDSLCVTGLNAQILDTMGRYIQIGAELSHAGRRPGGGCDCREAGSVYTVIYFTPQASGTYIFGTRKPSVVNNWPPNATTYHAVIR